MSSRDRVIQRSGGRCEVMVRLNLRRWTRCGKPAPDVHHMLPRSRGGDVLDEQAETLHLINLCRHHHNWIHAYPGMAESAGLTIEGQVTIEGSTVVYRGPHPALSERYGKVRA